MTSFFSKALEKMAGKKEMRILIMGLDASGKTTIVYQLKLGYVVTTIPTIGFNVESVQHKNINFTIWDVGGKDKIRPLWRHYYQNTQAVIFVIDSNDRQRLAPYADDTLYHNIGYDFSSAKGLLNTLLQEVELQDVIYLFYANKQDLHNAMTPDEITSAMNLETMMQNHLWHIEACCATTGDGLYEGLDWLCDIFSKGQTEIQRMKQQRELRIFNKTKTILLISGYVRNSDKLYALFTPVGITKMIHCFHQDVDEFFNNKYTFYGEYHDDCVLLDRLKVKQPQMMIRFLRRSVTDAAFLTEDDFVAQLVQNGKLQQYNVDSIDYQWLTHYDFMRMIWIFFVRYGRQNGLKSIWKYTNKSVTRTYFWCQMIHFGMNNHSNTETLNLIQSDFDYFLVMNPCLCNDFVGLIHKYYSKEVLNVMDNQQKEVMILADLQSLPSIVTDIHNLKRKQNVNDKEQNESKQHKEEEDDALFIEAFETRSYKSWNGHISFLRVLWCFVEEFDGRKGCVSKIRNEWKLYQKERFHETIMYFWVHMVRFWRASFKEYVAKDKHKNIVWNFKSFAAFCEENKKCKLLNEEWWKEFYDEAIMFHKGFHDIDASKQMLLPNKKQLPQFMVTKK